MFMWWWLNCAAAAAAAAPPETALVRTAAAAMASSPPGKLLLLSMLLLALWRWLARLLMSLMAGMPLLGLAALVLPPASPLCRSLLMEPSSELVEGDTEAAAASFLALAAAEAAAAAASAVLSWLFSFQALSSTWYCALSFLACSSYLAFCGGCSAFHLAPISLAICAKPILPCVLQWMRFLRASSSGVGASSPSISLRWSWKNRL
mmetsp:Transcript_10962/g.31445  ORF Transcript_10962/g.31445 Transcript_10962/m.31445 type:complete len:206 (-) Transcript_10962:611-1228(-)